MPVAWIEINKMAEPAIFRADSAGELGCIKRSPVNKDHNNLCKIVKKNLIINTI